MDITTWLLVVPLIGMAITFPLLSAKIDRNYVYRKKWRYIVWVLFFGGVGIYLAGTGYTFADDLEDRSHIRYPSAVIGAWLGLAITLIAYRSKKILFATQLPPEQVRKLTDEMGPYRSISNHPMTWKLMLVGFAIIAFAINMDEIIPEDILPVSHQYQIIIWFAMILTGLAVGLTGFIWDEYELHKQKTVQT